MTFGKRASAVKEEKKLQQKDIAYNIGTTPAVLSRYLSDQMIPSVIVAGKIAQELGVSLDYLVFGMKEEVRTNTSIGIKLQQIEKLSQEDQDHFLAVLAAFLAKAKLQDILGE